MLIFNKESLQQNTYREQFDKITLDFFSWHKIKRLYSQYPECNDK